MQHFEFITSFTHCVVANVESNGCIQIEDCVIASLVINHQAKDAIKLACLDISQPRGTTLARISTHHALPDLQDLEDLKLYRWGPKALKRSTLHASNLGTWFHTSI